MSDEAETVVESKPKRRGRPPGKATKVRPRHELTAAPVDGDYQPLAVTNKNPAFHYVAMSAHDRKRRGHRYEVERWSENCAHAPYETFSEAIRGQEVKINGELFLMRIPKERDLAFKRRELATFNAAKDGVAQESTGVGHEVRPEKRVVTHSAIPVSHIY